MKTMGTRMASARGKTRVGLPTSPASVPMLKKPDHIHSEYESSAPQSSGTLHVPLPLYQSSSLSMMRPLLSNCVQLYSPLLSVHVSGLRYRTPYAMNSSDGTMEIAVSTRLKNSRPAKLKKRMKITSATTISEKAW